MANVNKNCVICNENQWKYRCPTCRIVYCSVPCYKQHKAEDSCVKQLEQGPAVSNDDRATLLEVQREEGEMSSAEDSEPEADVDRLKPEQLERLGESESLKALLQNHHLRALLTHLNQAENKDKAIGGAMQEPIFAEFADACLAATRVDDNDADINR